jgi:hypothetical protein
MRHLVLPSLSDLIGSGIFAIIDNRNIFIGYSSNMLQAVSLQLESIKEGSHSYISSPISDIQVALIETTSTDLKARQTYWCDHYTKEGYTVLNTKRLLRYRTRIRIDHNYNVLVELVSKNKQSQIVGVFAKVSEAKAFVTFLESNSPIVPITASNQLTRKYLEDNGNRKI